MELTIDHLLHSDQVELLCTAVAIAEAAAKRSKTLQAKAFVRDLRRQIVRAELFDPGDLYCGRRRMDDIFTIERKQ